MKVKGKQIETDRKCRHVSTDSSSGSDSQTRQQFRLPRALNASAGCFHQGDSRCPDEFLTHLRSTFWDALQKWLLGSNTRVCLACLQSEDKSKPASRQSADNPKSVLLAHETEQGMFCCVVSIKGHLPPCQQFSFSCQRLKSKIEHYYSNINHMARPSGPQRQFRACRSVDGQFSGGLRNRPHHCQRTAPRWLVKIWPIW